MVRSVACAAVVLIWAGCGPAGTSGNHTGTVDGGDGGEACEDGRIDGDETDVDCGGLACRSCGTGRMCLHASDCASGQCNNNRCVPVGDHCTNGIHDGDETAVDCGGPTCARCALGRPCKVPDDCASGSCAGGVCSPSNPDMITPGDGPSDGGGDGPRLDGGDGGDGGGSDGGVDGGFDGGSDGGVDAGMDGGPVDGGVVD